MLPCGRFSTSDQNVRAFAELNEDRHGEIRSTEFSKMCSKSGKVSFPRRCLPVAQPIFSGIGDFRCPQHPQQQSTMQADSLSEYLYGLFSSVTQLNTTQLIGVHGSVPCYSRTYHLCQHFYVLLDYRVHSSSSHRLVIIFRGRTQDPVLRRGLPPAA